MRILTIVSVLRQKFSKVIDLTPNPVTPFFLPVYFPLSLLPPSLPLQDGMPLGGGEGGAYDTAVDAILSATNCQHHVLY